MIPAIFFMLVYLVARDGADLFIAIRKLRAIRELQDRKAKR